MREMRRKDRQMDKEFAYAIMDKAEFGTLATINEDGSPYCIPVSFVRLQDKVYFHSAKQGLKIDNILRTSRVCMSFVGDVKVPNPDSETVMEELLKSPDQLKEVASSKFTTYYESAVIFGSASIIEDKEEKILGLRLLCEKYNPWNMPYFKSAIESSIKLTDVIRIDIEHITGKSKA